jgi:hypothetical protein
MARVTGTIANFINGISQQPYSIRLPSQAESQINCYSTVAKGLSRRPPSEHITKISASQDPNSFVHLINRDVSERYVVVVDNTEPTNKLKVFDFDGTEKTVTAPNGFGYLASADPDADIEALTVADYTFFINKKTEVAKDVAVSSSQNPKALISFGTIQPGSRIQVRINGSLVADEIISDTDPSELETNDAASRIRADLVASGYNSGSWSCSLTESGGSVIHLENTAGSDFNVTVRDGSNGLGIKVIKDKIQYFEDLPRQGKNGFTVKIAGDPVTGFGSYWVKFTGDNDGIATWEEALEPGLLTSLDASTMPHSLIRNSDGTFTFDQVSWDTRNVGDDDSNEFPSFVGETINDIYFHRSRLAVLAGESTIMSEAGEFFNFFRTTVTSLVDSDPIDVGTNHTKVSILRHAVPYQEQLLLFSDQTQFRLTQGNVLSPNEVGIEPITEFESSIAAKPAPVGNFIFFAVEKSDFASLREYFVADDSQRNDAREITGHVPNYIPAGIKRIKGSSNEDVLVIQSEGGSEPTFYVYKYFFSGNEKIQSSWSSWTFPDGEKVMGYDFIKSTLYLVIERSDGIYLEKMELDTGNQDDSNTGYNLLLDRKVFSDNSEVTPVYDGGTDKTTYTFSSIVWESKPLMVGIEGNSIDNPPGYSVDIEGTDTFNSNTVVCDGDTTADDFVFGIPFESEYEPSRIVAKRQDSRGSQVPITEGRLQLFWMTLRYAFTGYFRVEVTADGRDTNIYEFNGRTLGSSDNPINDIPIDEDGSMRVPLYSRADRVRVVVKSSDFLPMRLISADWIGNLIQKFRRI